MSYFFKTIEKEYEMQNEEKLKAAINLKKARNDILLTI